MRLQMFSSLFQTRCIQAVSTQGGETRMLEPFRGSLRSGVMVKLEVGRGLLVAPPQRATR